MYKVTWKYIDCGEGGFELFESLQEAEVFYFEGIQEINGTPDQDVYCSTLKGPSGNLIREWDPSAYGE